MPLPAILAALARVGAGIAARVGATGAARTMVSAARGVPLSAADSVQELARQRLATSFAPVKGAGFRVLENTQLGNAGALFQAIYGKGRPTGAPAAPPVSTSQMAAAASAPPLPPPTGAPAAPPAAARPGSTPPPNPRPQGLLDRMVDTFHRTRDTVRQMQQRFSPVAEQVSSMTMDQRYQRLEKAGKLLDQNVVARSTGTPNPTREQITHQSEAEEERQRQAAVQSSNWQQVGQAGWNAGKKTLAGTLAMTNPMGMATAPIWLQGVITGFEKLGKTISETNRDLTKFDGRIADSFARLDFSQLRSRQQVARATSGSAAFLNDSLAALVRELQPMRNALTTVMNGVGILAVNVARLVNVLLKMHPVVAAGVKAAEEAERRLAAKNEQESQGAAKDFMRAIRDGKFSMPSNKVPGER